MKLKLTLQRPAGPEADVVVTTDAAASVTEIADRLLRFDPLAAPQETVSPHTLRVTFPNQLGTVTLPPEMPISEASIASGADVTVIPVQGELIGGPTGPVLAQMRVVDGPDVGKEFQLRSGTVILGREAPADIVLADSLVSKRHARIDVTDTVNIVDLNSANGIIVDGGEVTRVSLGNGQTVLIGGTTLRVDIVGGEREAAQRARTGTVQFNRSPSVEKRYPGQEYEGPTAPKELDPVTFPWLPVVAPLIAGLGLYYFTQLPQTLIFVALAPIIMVGTYFSQRSSNARKLKKAIERFDDKLGRLDEVLKNERLTERVIRNAEAPSTESLVASARNLGPSLWMRRPEHWSFLTVRLGLGTVESRNTVEQGNAFDGIAEYQERLDALIENYRLIDGVPLVENVVDAGALGVAGDQRAAAEFTNALLAQFTALHSPVELSISALVSPVWAKELEWVKWLPHAASAQSPLSGIHLADTAVSGTTLLAAIEELIEDRLEKISDEKASRREAIDLEDSAMGRGPVAQEGKEVARPKTPVLVLLISDDAPLDRPRLTSMLERAARAGVLPIWIAPGTDQLPAVCRTFVDLEQDGENLATVGYVRTGMEVRDVEVSRLSHADALAYARQLSGVADASAVNADESDIPRSVSFLSLLGTEMAESSDAVIDRWRQNDSIHNRVEGAPLTPKRAGKLRALVGQSSVDSMHLDLRSQGPHALVGGTTGSGKSEFLQAWVLGMAAEYSPDRVTFLFVDYKGGSAFADCVQLPHCVGLVTDLSPHLVRRALTSLRAELHFRERLLNRKKAKDLIELEKRGDPESPPALVLVIDEFAALVGEVPEFVDGVVDIAQRGRSLGIHLIMATQRPAGVIKDNLRANTNLRIALRMADESDSVDVVGTPVAGGFDPAIPGRAIAKMGPGRLTGFQSGYAGGWTSNDASPSSVEIGELAFGNDRVWEDPAPSHDDEIDQVGPNDTARLVATMVGAAKAAEIPAPRKPWLDELAPAYDLAKLRQRTDTELIIGVVDDATKQAQYPVYFRPDVDGNIAVYGTGGSGKSVALRTIAVAAAITPRGGPVQVYAIDFGSGGLRLLEDLPHVGAVISGDDSERIARLMTKLRRIIDERVPRFAAVRASTITEYRRLANEPNEPRILLLIDGMATFRAEYEFSNTAAFAMFQQIITDGRQVGVHAVLSADRPASISPSVSASVQRKIALRLTDEFDYSALDAPSDVLSANSSPGRAVLDGLEAQIAVLGGSSNMADQSRAIEALAQTMLARGVVPAAPIEKLSDDIALAPIIGSLPGSIVLGVDDVALAPVGFSPDGVFMLSGPPSSGRTTALRTLVASTRQAVPGIRLFYFGNAKSIMGSLPVWERTATSIESVVELAREVAGYAATPAGPGNRIGIVVESISEFLSTPADAELMAMFKAAKRSDHLVIAESETSTWAPSWPLLMEIKSGRRGFALQPDQQEGDMMFRTTFPRARRADFPQGRGWFVQAGKVRKVQIAHDDGGSRG